MAQARATRVAETLHWMRHGTTVGVRLVEGAWVQPTQRAPQAAKGLVHQTLKAAQRPPQAHPRALVEEIWQREQGQGLAVGDEGW